MLLYSRPFSSALADRGGNNHMMGARYSLILLSMSHLTSARRVRVNAIPPSNAYPDIKVVSVCTEDRMLTGTCLSITENWPPLFDILMACWQKEKKPYHTQRFAPVVLLHSTLAGEKAHELFIMAGDTI